ncbi:hypothetical protein [Streptomyces sp. NPDC001221]
MIVCPLGWGTIRLVVGDDGRAEGRFLPAPSYFMAVRNASTTGTPPHPGRPATTIDRYNALHLPAVAEDEAFRFVLPLTVPDVGFASERGDNGLVNAVELWTSDGSWARAEHRTVRQAGPRLLWDAVEAAHMLFAEHGRPGRERFGVTVTREGQRIWLDHPGREVFRASPLG